MAKRNDQRGGSPGDYAEFTSGRASSGDKRELGFVKSGGRLVPGKRTPARFKSAYKAATKRRKGGPTKKRAVSRSKAR